MNERIWYFGGMTQIGEKPKYSGKNLSQCHFVHHKNTGIKSVVQIRGTGSSVTDIFVILDVTCSHRMFTRGTFTNRCDLHL